MCTGERCFRGSGHFLSLKFLRGTQNCMRREIITISFDHSSDLRGYKQMYIKIVINRKCVNFIFFAHNRN